MPEIRIQGLHYRYPSFDPRDPVEPPWALRGIDLTIPAGEFLGIAGTMGSGKSTVCLALMGLVPQQTGGTIRGDVWIGDRNTKRTPAPEIATEIGIVFQDPEANFLGLNVEDEVAFGLENLNVDPDLMEDRVLETLEIVGIRDLAQRRITSLSGGQKQRVAIAAALAMRPEALILDDPTAELDPDGRASVIQLVADLARTQNRMTIIMAGNDVETMARHAQRMIVLDAGQVVAEGSPEEIFSSGSKLPDGVPRPELLDISTKLEDRVGHAINAVGYEKALTTLRTHLAPVSDVSSAGEIESAGDCDGGG